MQSGPEQSRPGVEQSCLLCPPSSLPADFTFHIVCASQRHLGDFVVLPFQKHRSGLQWDNDHKFPLHPGLFILLNTRPLLPGLRERPLVIPSIFQLCPFISVAPAFQFKAEVYCISQSNTNRAKAQSTRRKAELKQNQRNEEFKWSVRLLCIVYSRHSWFIKNAVHTDTGGHLDKVWSYLLS